MGTFSTVKTRRGGCQLDYQKQLRHISQLVDDGELTMLIDADAPKGWAWRWLLLRSEVEALATAKRAKARGQGRSR